MISNRMYRFLSVLPPDYKAISFQEIKKKSGLTDEMFKVCMIEHQFRAAKGSYLFQEVFQNKETKANNLILTDEGLAEVETYEQQMKIQKASIDSLEAANKTLLIAKLTLLVSIIALIVSIFK